MHHWLCSQYPIEELELLSNPQWVFKTLLQLLVYKKKLFTIFHRGAHQLLGTPWAFPSLRYGWKYSHYWNRFFTTGIVPSYYYTKFCSKIFSSEFSNNVNYWKKWGVWKSSGLQQPSMHHCQIFWKSQITFLNISGMSLLCLNSYTLLNSHRHNFR